MRPWHTTAWYPLDKSRQCGGDSSPSACYAGLANQIFAWRLNQAGATAPTGMVTDRQTGICGFDRHNHWPDESRESAAERRVRVCTKQIDVNCSISAGLKGRWYLTHWMKRVQHRLVTGPDDTLCRQKRLENLAVDPPVPRILQQAWQRISKHCRPHRRENSSWMIEGRALSAVTRAPYPISK